MTTKLGRMVQHRVIQFFTNFQLVDTTITKVMNFFLGAHGNTSFFVKRLQSMIYTDFIVGIAV